MRKLRSGPVVAVVALLAMTLVAAGCGKSKNKSGGGAATITVGSDIPYPPFEFGQSPYQGFDVDVVSEIGKRINRKPKFIKTSFDTIFRDLAQGKFDMVASSTTITPERQKEVDFSVPYFPADQSLMVKKGSSIKTVADLAGKIVGAQSGTTGADYAKKKTETKTVRTYEQVDDAFKALETGQVDAVINDFPVSKYAERSHPDLVVVQTIPTGEKYGIAFQKGSSLKAKVDKAIADMKSDGTYTKIYRKWFQQDPPASFLNQGGSASSTATKY